MSFKRVEDLLRDSWLFGDVNLFYLRDRALVSTRIGWWHCLQVERLLQVWGWAGAMGGEQRAAGSVTTN